MPRNSRSRRLLLTLLFAAASVTIFAAAVEQKGAAYRFLGVFREVWALVRENYVEPVDEAQLLDGAMRGMAATDANADCSWPAARTMSWYVMPDISLTSAPAANSLGPP